MVDYTKWNTFMSCDLGYGDVKICLKKEDGTLMIAKFPSAVAKVSPKRFGAGEAVEFEGDHYLIGENAINYKPVEMNDYETLERYSPLLVFHAFRKYGEFDTIVTGLSIRQEDQSGDFKDRLSNFVIDGTEYNLDDNKKQALIAKVQAKAGINESIDYSDCEDIILDEAAVSKIKDVLKAAGSSVMAAGAITGSLSILGLLASFLDKAAMSYMGTIGVLSGEGTNMVINGAALEFLSNSVVPIVLLVIFGMGVAFLKWMD